VARLLRDAVVGDVLHSAHADAPITPVFRRPSAALSTTTMSGMLPDEDDVPEPRLVSAPVRRAASMAALAR